MFGRVTFTMDSTLLASKVLLVAKIKLKVNFRLRANLGFFYGMPDFKRRTKLSQTGSRISARPSCSLFVFFIDIIPRTRIGFPSDFSSDEKT